MTRNAKPRLVRTLLALLLSATGAAALAQDQLAIGFADPPMSARPRVWWHWMNGNVTKEGIAKDLDWMKRVGIGGIQNFDADLATPQVVDKRLLYMTPEWKDAFRFAAARADQLGLELAIAGSPGWSETGGPWVQPQDGLKKIVWSEIDVTGGRRLRRKLPSPPAATGPFQTIPLSDPLAAIGGGKAKPPPTYYADVAVLAYPVPPTGNAPVSRIEAGGKSIDPTPWSDQDFTTSADIVRGTADDPTIIGISYPAARTIASATLFIAGETSPFTGPSFTPVLEARRPEGWVKIAELPLANVPTTSSFAPVSAREFRIVLAPVSGPPRTGVGEGAPGAVAVDFFPPPDPKAPVKIAELDLRAEQRIDRFEEKAGFAIAQNYYALSAGLADAPGVPLGKVVDLTGRMRPDGTLDWAAPPGCWRIVRLGYSLLGTTNHPAPPEATGLEVDKLDGTAVRNYLETYLGMYRDASGGMIGDRGVRALLTDSIEVGAANWTPRMIDQFKRLRGYDPTPWLPTLTGAVIGSRSASDRFLYDYRRTLADLMASEHYGTVATVAHEHGLKVYGEALEDVRPSLGDDIAMRSHTDIPMAALWTWKRGGNPRSTLLGDMKGASSVAHLFGQNIAAAESMTAANAPWAFAPSDLRPMIDLEFAYGINRPVIHTSVHQPVDDKLPGVSLAIFGQYFNRHETWAEMAQPWVAYLSRTSFMLQQGRNFADVAYFFGEEAPLTALFAQQPLPDLPTRYAYDFVDPDALLSQLSVEDGAVVAKSGARYGLIYLGGTSTRMTVPVLRRLAQLAEQGATIVGRAPRASPSQSDDPAGFAALVRKLWSGGAVTQVGRGCVIDGSDAEAALESIGVVPDFEYSGARSNSEILFVHRRLEDGDAYFLTNRTARAERIEGRFRVSGKVPEIWHADTGTIEPVSYRIEGNRTIVPLDFEAEESFFVVFRKSAVAQAADVPRARFQTVAALDGAWDVAFQPGRGAPPTLRIPQLASLSDNADPAVRYFSGTTTYRRHFNLPSATSPGRPLLLDLGRIGDVAEVRVNGSLVGTTWHAPWRIDIGKAVRRGSNVLDIRVANLWVNRLIGDARPGAKKITWTALPTYKPDAPLRPAGLIGPVTLLAVDVEEAKRQ